MRRALLVALALLAAGCSRRASRNYKHCLKLRVGMTREELFKIMGPPEDTIPYVEGKSLPYLKGRTAYEWSNPASMPGPDHVSFSEEQGQIESIRCSNADITASVYVEPPAPSTATAVALSTPVAAPAASTAPVAAPAPADLPAALAAYAKKDLQKTFDIARPLAEADDAQAQLLLGLIFSDERAAGPENDARALKWFYRSGRRGNGEAAYGYAMMIEKSGANPAKIVEETLLAASLNCPAALLREAKMELDGYQDAVAKDPEGGAKLLKSAAEAGSTKAVYERGLRARDAKDPVSARRWLSEAAKHPLVDKYADPLNAFSHAWSAADRDAAAKALSALEAGMTPAQLKQAKSAE